MYGPHKRLVATVLLGRLWKSGVRRHVLMDSMKKVNSLDNLEKDELASSRAETSRLLAFR
jgi:hypothetical protein